SDGAASVVFNILALRLPCFGSRGQPVGMRRRTSFGVLAVGTSGYADNHLVLVGSVTLMDGRSVPSPSWPVPSGLFHAGHVPSNSALQPGLAMSLLLRFWPVRSRPLSGPGFQARPLPAGGRPAFGQAPLIH